MLKVCCDALNAVAPTAPTPKAARERCGKMTRPDKNFCGSIGVRFGTNRAKIELSPAENHWRPRRARSGVRARSALVRIMPRIESCPFAPMKSPPLPPSSRRAARSRPLTAPDLPVKTRVKVPRGVPGQASPVWTGYVASAPIRAADGLWYVAVMVYGGVERHPVDNLARCSNGIAQVAYGKDTYRTERPWA